MQRKGYLGLAIVLLLTLATPVQAATPKAGAKCTKAGITATAAGKKFTCVKSGNKLVWNKGVAIKAAPKPSPNPVFTPAEPTPTPVVKYPDAPTNFDEAQTTDEKLYARFFHALLSGGIAIAPGAYEALFVGMGHTDAVMEQLAVAAHRAAHAPDRRGPRPCLGAPRNEWAQALRRSAIGPRRRSDFR